jgi:hypothetical protein
MRPVLIAAVLAACASAPLAHAEDRTASGRFEVTLVPEAEGADGGHDRTRVDKVFHGGMEGKATGEMLGLYDARAGSGAYVLIERFEGLVEGREGGFSLVHRGLMAGGAPDLEITIVPGSGTGGLRGISGRFELDLNAEGHRYTLHYSVEGETGR